MRKLKQWLMNKEKIPLNNYNEFTRTWSKGYRKAIQETLEFIKKRIFFDRSLFIVSALVISFLFTFFLVTTPHKIDINSSSVEALESLPDIGEVLARRIVEGRPYNDIYELDRVKGIGPQTIEAIKSKVVAK